VHDWFPGCIPIIRFANPSAHQELDGFATDIFQNGHTTLETARVTVIKSDDDLPVVMLYSKGTKSESGARELCELLGEKIN